MRSCIVVLTSSWSSSVARDGHTYCCQTAAVPLELRQPRLGKLGAAVGRRLSWPAAQVCWHLLSSWPESTWWWADFSLVAFNCSAAVLCLPTLWRPLLPYTCTGTAINHPVPDRVKPSECPDVKDYKWWLNPVWHRMLYSCTRMSTVGVKGSISFNLSIFQCTIALIGACVDCGLQEAVLDGRRVTRQWSSSHCSVEPGRLWGQHALRRRRSTVWSSYRLRTQRGSVWCRGFEAL